MEHPPLPVSSLRLLIPPLRLMSAAMWQVTKRRLVKHYGKLEDFVCLVTEAMPELLSHRQRSLLLLGLRAKMTLELFGSDLCADPDVIQTHVNHIRSISLNTSTELAIEESKANLIALTQLLLGDPAERRNLIEGVFDQNFDAALQSLVCDFLCKLDELLPVPDFKQAASWLESAPRGVEECVQSVSACEDLRTLLQSRACDQALPGTAAGCQAEDLLLTFLSSPFTAQLTSPSHDDDGQSAALSEWEAGALEHGRLETEGVEVVIMGETGVDTGETAGTDRGVCTQPEEGAAEEGAEPATVVVIGQDLGSTGGGGTNSIPAVLSLIALNQTPVVFIPQQTPPSVVSLSLPALPLPATATGGQSGVVCPSRQSGPAKVRGAVTVPGVEPHTPPSHTLVNSICPEPSSQSGICQGEDSDTGDRSTDPSRLSPPLSGSAFVPADSAPPGASHNIRRVAHKCPQCGKCFIYRSQVLRHLRTHKARPGTSHKCAQCGLGFRTLLALSEHKRAACTGAAFECPLCGKAFASLREQHRHRLAHKANSCFQCAAGFQTKAELASHLRTHRVKSPHQCCLCGKRFRLLSSLTNHKQTHSAGGGFACTRCECVFASARERDAHRQTHRAPVLSCPVCGEAFTSQAKLIRHQQTHPAPDGQAQRYKCRHCDETFAGLTRLRIHQRGHMEKPHRCEQCGKAFGTPGGLHSHRGTHTGERPFLCTHCGKSFRTKDGLEGHLRIHTGEKPFQCTHCGKRFTALAGLNVHVRRHTGERPYVCEVCGKGWPSGGDLQKHMRSHTGEKPYGCAECGKSFSISCHLTEHMRSHSGEKPFTCPECGKSLKRKFDLKKHMLSHSDIRPFPCSHCDKSYTRRTHLNRHLQTHSAGNP